MMSKHPRADPFAGDFDVSDFRPTPRKGPAAPKEEIRQVSEANDFPSRAPERSKPANPEKTPQRRRRTGRNVQFNIKATAETIARFTALADKKNIPFGELLDQLLEKAE